MNEVLKPCPYCNSIKYDYALTVGTLLSESFHGITELDLKKLFMLPIFREFIAAPASFIRYVFQNIPEAPPLLCKVCRNYILSCPTCDTYFVIPELASISQIYRCSQCKTGFQTCEMNSRFNRLLHKNGATQWIVAFIQAILLLLVVYALYKLFA